MQNRWRKKRRRRNIGSILFGVFIFIAIAIAAFVGVRIYGLLTDDEPEVVVPQPDEILMQYMAYINEGKYAEMYSLLSEHAKDNISQEEFILKNKNIYEGIDAKNLTISITEMTEQYETQMICSYGTRMDTLAGEISFSNRAIFTKLDEEYKLLWTPQIIFPMITGDDKIRVNTLKAERGAIYDRDGEMLAGKGDVVSVGFVPGKMREDSAADIARVSVLLDIPIETINKKLNASYVKADTFVPVKMIARNQTELEAELMKIKGIMLTNTSARVYPYGEKISHLTGYIQNVSAEDLERLEGLSYNANSVIGKAGLERIYEERLRGIDGYEIIVVDETGKKKQTLATIYQKDGENITLTIDIDLQAVLYERFVEDRSASVAINPKTGEVLALVSTPAYDANDFILGMSVEKWDSLNNNVNKPLYNRFMATLAPGSGFKAIISAIGISTGRLDPSEDFGASGKSWQKDGSWGRYNITTVTQYSETANMQNALIYSDNIYFAKAALRIGGDLLSEQLLSIGFEEKIPFEYGLYSSIFSNTDSFYSEIQVADSGYGQAQVLVNPVHMAAMYSAFVNGGSMIKPCLIYEESQQPQYWKEQAFTKDAADTVRRALVQVIEQSVGGAAKVEGMLLGGKTGTAEIKTSQDDEDGTELGWFNVFTADPEEENPLLIITMVEDVKDRGGSGYVVQKITEIIREY